MIHFQMHDIELEPYGHVNASDKEKGLQEAMTGDEQSTTEGRIKEEETNYAIQYLKRECDERERERERSPIRQPFISTAIAPTKLLKHVLTARATQRQSSYSGQPHAPLGDCMGSSQVAQPVRYTDHPWMDH